MRYRQEQAHIEPNPTSAFNFRRQIWYHRSIGTNDRTLRWIGTSLDGLRKLPLAVQSCMGFCLIRRQMREAEMLDAAETARQRGQRI